MGATDSALYRTIEADVCVGQDTGIGHHEDVDPSVVQREVAEVSDI